jgi:hypothetical protein
LATTEEKVELVETLKGPRYYRIQINGYGGESAYMSISKEAHDFWNAHNEEHGDHDMVQYMIADDLEECEFDDLDTVPVEAQFLNDPEDDMYKRPWYESHTEFEHTYGAEYGSAYISVEEVESEEYSASNINEVMYNESISDLNDVVGEETEWAHELVEMGCFFDGVIETIGDFDSKKLKVFTTEFLNGEDTITEVHYDGVEVDNNGGDTNGKGYYASVWAN